MRTTNKLLKQVSGYILLLSFIISFAGCMHSDANIVKEIHIGLHNNNELKIQLDVLTISKTTLYAEYWPDSSATSISKAVAVTKDGLSHTVIMCNILPKTSYSYHIVTLDNNVKNVGKTFAFQSRTLPLWLQDQFKYSCISLDSLPADFKDGFMLLNKREMPGVAYIVDPVGRLRWYHVIENMGLKVTHLTKDKTVLSILGTSADSTSYGREILEINLLGDTLLDLKKGQGDFTNIIHHEILKNDNGEVVTIFEDKKEFDLSAVGGSKKDTVSSDGIIVMDSHGKKIWRWSVFDVQDPLKDPAILKNKKDWTHANSLNYDKDGNYLISFYNLGQIWKVDAKTGKVYWKFGRGGTFTMPADCDFTESHAVHINAAGNMMFFDNGVAREQSQVFAMKLDEEHNTSTTDLHIKLPQAIYNARMGSAYMVNDTSFLCCCSKRHITVLMNRRGEIIWTLDTAVPPYRVEFVKKEQLNPWLQF